MSCLLLKTAQHYFSPPFFLCLCRPLKKKGESWRGKKKEKIETENWIELDDDGETKTQKNRVFSLSLSRDRWWNGDDDHHRSLFFAHFDCYWKEKRKRNTYNNNTNNCIRILPLEKPSSHLHGLHIFYRFFHRTGHVGDRNRSLYYWNTFIKTSFISSRRLLQSLLQSRVRGRDECACHGHHFIRFLFVNLYFWIVVRVSNFVIFVICDFFERNKGRTSE